MRGEGTQPHKQRSPASAQAGTRWSPTDPSSTHGYLLPFHSRLRRTEGHRARLQRQTHDPTAAYQDCYYERVARRSPGGCSSPGGPSSATSRQLTGCDPAEEGTSCLAPRPYGNGGGGHGLCTLRLQPPRIPRAHPGPGSPYAPSQIYFAYIL